MPLSRIVSCGTVQSRQSPLRKRRYNRTIHNIHWNITLHFTRLYVGDLPADTSEPELRDLVRWGRFDG